MFPPSGFLKTLALFAMAWIFACSRAVASEPPAPILLTEKPAPVFDISPHAEFLIDPSTKLDIAQILSPPWSGEFKPPPASPPSFGFTKAAVWMRCEIRSASSQVEPFAVLLRYARIVRLEWFVVANGRVEKSLVNGTSVPSSEPARHPMIEFRIPPGETRTLFVRSTSDTAQMLSFVAGSPGPMERAESRESALDLLLIGACFAAVAFLGFQSLTQRQPMFFHLAMFAGSFALYYAIYHGYVGQFWPARPFWIERAGFMAIASLVGFFFLRFNSAYLDIRSLARHERLMLHTSEFLMLFVAALAFFIDFPTGIKILSLSLVASILLTSTVVVLRARHVRRLEEIWFFLAWIVFGTSICLIALKVTAILPVSIFFEVLQRFLAPGILVGFFLVASARQRSLQQLEIQLAETEALRSQAERERDAKSLFLANVSHEIRTPLSALVGLSQAMWLRSESSAPDSEFTRFLNRVRSGGHYLGLLLRNVLNFSAAESGRVPVRLEEFYLADWIDEVRNILEPLADYHRGRLEWFLPDSDEIRFRTDEMRLTQILLNLAENALKFGAESGKPVTIRLEKTAGGLRIAVEDHGPGIPEDRMKSVFAEYEQAGGVSLPMATGVGLGLSVVKLNTTLLGGTVAIEKIPDAGMRFSVEIPGSPGQESPDSALPASPDL
jgi:signal transduction histidine kinase